MANLQLYSLAYVTMDGALLTEEASVSITRNLGSQAVSTVMKGYAGECPGASMVEIQVTNAVPAAGFEFNAQGKMQSFVPAEIGLIVGGQTIQVKGFIISDSFKHSVNSESTYEFTFRGQFALFQ
jgi:hypothetical protein